MSLGFGAFRIWLCVIGAAALHGCASAAESVSGSKEAAWKLVWADEFDGDALDQTKWKPEESCWGGGNNERQCYTDRTENVRVENGTLILKAQPEVFTGPLYPAHYPQFNNEVREQPYTSGKVVTHGKADWKYGRISARIKLPAGQGPWTAFWMMPTESKYGGWPLSGEIDIMESVNLETACEECPQGVEYRTSGAAHFGGEIPDNTYLYFKTGHEKPDSPARDWRVYSVEWAEGIIQWFIDGDIVMRLDEDDWHTAAEDAQSRNAAPFDQKFYLNINLAVGGNLSEFQNEGGVDESAFPAEMLIDWVRVEQCEGDLETGRACLSKQKWDGAPFGPSDNRAP